MGSEYLKVEAQSLDDSSVQGEPAGLWGHHFFSALMIIRAGRCLRQLGLMGCQTGLDQAGTSSVLPGTDPTETEGNQAWGR